MHPLRELDGRLTSKIPKGPGGVVDSGIVVFGWYEEANDEPRGDQKHIFEHRLEEWNHVLILCSAPISSATIFIVLSIFVKHETGLDLEETVLPPAQHA